MDKGWRVEKCSTSTTTDVVKTLKRKMKKTLKWKKKKSVKKETRELRKWEENLATEKNKEVVKSNGINICVKGFDASLPTDAIKTALTDHFAPCGVIFQVLVPRQCRTSSASNGYAHVGIRTRDPDKALALDGSLLGGRRLEVRRAILGRPGYNLGCKTCPVVLMDGVIERFYATRNGYFLSPEIVRATKERVQQWRDRKFNERKGASINEEEVHQSNNQ